MSHFQNIFKNVNPDFFFFYIKSLSFTFYLFSPLLLSTSKLCFWSIRHDLISLFQTSPREVGEDRITGEHFRVTSLFPGPLRKTKRSCLASDSQSFCVASVQT